MVSINERDSGKTSLLSTYISTYTFLPLWPWLFVLVRQCSIIVLFKFFQSGKPQKKKFRLFKSGERDGHKIGPRRPIHPSAYYWLRYFSHWTGIISRAPSCSYHICRHSLSDTSSNRSSIYGETIAKLHISLKTL